MSWRKGAVDAVYKASGLEPKDVPAEVTAAVDRIARAGGTPLGGVWWWGPHHPKYTTYI